MYGVFCTDSHLTINTVMKSSFRRYLFAREIITLKLVFVPKVNKIKPCLGGDDDASLKE